MNAHCGQASSVGSAHFPGPLEELPSNLFGYSLTIGDLLCKHVPHHDEQLARDRQPSASVRLSSSWWSARCWLARRSER